MARAQACALCCLKLLVVLSVVLIAAGFLLPDLLQYALDMGVSKAWHHPGCQCHAPTCQCPHACLAALA